LLETARLIGEDAEEVVCVGVARVGLKDLLIKLLGLIEVAQLMILKC
jgi:hypothetical protein